MKSPFERVAQLPALEPYCRRLEKTEAGKPAQLSGKGASRLHGGIAGFLGAARALAIGALARGRGGEFIRDARGAGPEDAAKTPPSVVLAIVDGPESALDAIADLRAFRAAEESEEGRGTPNSKLKIKNSKLDSWADHTLPSAASLPADLRNELPLETTLFPAWDVLPTETDRPEGLALAGRLHALERLRHLRNWQPVAAGAGLHALVIVAPITALMQPCESPEETVDALVLHTGGSWDPILLGRRLVEAGFERTGQVEVRGEFSLRGGILDVFPYADERPFRIDFFGEQIESIQRFDPLTQCSEGSADAVTIPDSSPERLRKLFVPGASGGPCTLLDHLPPHAAVVWVDPWRLARRAELYAASLVSGRSLWLRFDELRDCAAARFDTLDLLPPAGEAEAGAAGPLTQDESREPRADAAEARSEVQNPGSEIACTSLQRLQGEIATHAAAWKQLAATRMALEVFCETAGDRTRLETLLTEAGILPAPSVRLVLGRISGGFDLREAGLAAISDREILGRRKHAAAAAPSSRKYKASAGLRPVASLFELHTGDHVVHAAHGIARYLGLVRLEKSGRMEDYLALLFDEQVKVYVPAAHIGWVSKYVGGEAEPQLSRLGSKLWARKKARAERAVREIAEDLLKVQATRKSLPGIVYGPDSEWQAAFEAAFPFEETGDQLAAIEAVKKDMQATCPMDRLLCGDVGFGKTEVAVRAAFKAVMDGKQVAVLVPTTLLCEQHGRTCAERFAGYPLAVETLSRFKTPGEQRRILQRLAAGRVDVVIGTHRLLQKDVRFQDLGLAIVDEEQRFGVEHKEFFKRLRKTVDVLTLTATPIPRTLHMALLGLRDISNLATPPRNRKSIVTKVARASDDLLRRAILREVSRGGQVFVVHPRVHDIEDFRGRLAALVPEARFAAGHGQMHADDLETVMSRFLHAEIDVLVSTTIVESGLDIPSANTMLVHEADRFGLSELHQLRGRVGRSDLQAYCYLLLPEQSAISPDGLRRLRALEEFDELGAGFQLAMKDLEIRGAGNVLGAQQSGQIAEVGYDLYCKLLDATVLQLRGEPPPEAELEVNLQLRGPAFVPEAYVQDERAVLEVYRRLDAAASDEAIEALRQEAVDRFGPPPEPVTRMFEEAKLRKLARLAGVPFVGLDKEERRLILKLHRWDLKAADRALRGLPEVRGVRVLDGETLSFPVLPRASRSEEALHQVVRDLLEALARNYKRAGRE